MLTSRDVALAWPARPRPRTPSWENTRQNISETHIANGRRKIFFPHSTKQLNPHPNFNVGCLVGHGFFVTRRRLPLAHNIEIWGKGRGKSWEEYFTSTVPGGPSFPQAKHLHLTDMRACLTDGRLRTIPSKEFGWKGHGNTWEEYFTSTVPGGASFPQTKDWVGRAGEAGKAGRATLALHRD